MIIPIKI